MGKTPAKKHSTSKLGGLNPLGLLDGVLGGQAGDWEPPLAGELELLFPGYHDFAFIDRGGMGAVYAATQRSLERRVAIKILPPEMGQDGAFVDRFHQEARLLARLQHPHIVAIYDFGRNASGHLFIVMEYVEGTSLLDVMKLERLPLGKVLEIITQVCDAMQFAHDHGVIHRDIKPTNILLDAWGRVRVADFGLAKLAVKAPHETTQSRSGVMMGTPGYAAPEQRRAEADLDHRADIFSVGVTLYEMVTGHLPMGVFEPPSKKAETPVMLDKIVTRALRERPQDRYQRASEMRSAIATMTERLQRPLMQRAIARRPIVSMMTCVIVTAGFIYLLDTLNKEVLQKPQPVPAASVDSEHGPTVLRLNDAFSIVRLRLNWEDARRRIRATPGLEMASFHTHEEWRQVADKLRETGIYAPVWTGGWADAKTGKYQWDDQSAFDFEAWMPAAVAPPLHITEIQAKNRRTLRDVQGNTPDWIEVHNAGPLPVDITGWHLRHLTGRYAFEGRLGGTRSRYTPDQLIVQPGEYKVIYCIEAEPPEDGRLSFGFQLEAQTGRIRWCDPRGNLIQSMDADWTQFAPDASLVSDDAGLAWGWAAKATPGAQNPPFQDSVPLTTATTAAATAQAILMLPDFDGRWALDTTRRTAWALVRRAAKAGPK